MKEFILDKVQTSNLNQKGKSWSSNANDPQIIITGLPSEQYKLGSSDYKEVCFSHFTTYASYRITIWLERSSVYRYPTLRVHAASRSRESPDDEGL